MMLVSHAQHLLCDLEYLLQCLACLEHKQALTYAHLLELSSGVSLARGVADDASKLR